VKPSPFTEKVLREGATEPPFSSALLHEDRHGFFRCAGCGSRLFSSDAKFESGTGWPSFDAALPGAVTRHQDRSHGVARVEIRCAKCGGHLGHVFDDGPTKTGLRYCTNGCALDFKPKPERSRS
jgi:peptide-methionine (R)-S-oxide reductase